MFRTVSALLVNSQKTAVSLGRSFSHSTPTTKLYKGEIQLELSSIDSVYKSTKSKVPPHHWTLSKEIVNMTREKIIVDECEGKTYNNLLWSDILYSHGEKQRINTSVETIQ